MMTSGTVNNKHKNLFHNTKTGQWEVLDKEQKDLGDGCHYVPSKSKLNAFSIKETEGSDLVYDPSDKQAKVRVDAVGCEIVKESDLTFNIGPGLVIKDSLAFPHNSVFSVGSTLHALNGTALYNQRAYDNILANWFYETTYINAITEYRGVLYRTTVSKKQLMDLNIKLEEAENDGMVKKTHKNIHTWRLVEASEIPYNIGTGCKIEESSAPITHLCSKGYTLYTINKNIVKNQVSYDNICANLNSEDYLPIIIGNRGNLYEAKLSKKELMGLSIKLEYKSPYDERMKASTKTENFYKFDGTYYRRYNVGKSNEFVIHFNEYGQIHREHDQPAMIFKNRTELHYYKNGSLHREYGPALIMENQRQYFLNGTEYSAKAWASEVRKRRAEKEKQPEQKKETENMNTNWAEKAKEIVAKKRAEKQSANLEQNVKPDWQNQHIKVTEKKKVLSVTDELRSQIKAIEKEGKDAGSLSFYQQHAVDELRLILDNTAEYTDAELYQRLRALRIQLGVDAKKYFESLDLAVSNDEVEKSSWLSSLFTMVASTAAGSGLAYAIYWFVT